MTSDLHDIATTTLSRIAATAGAADSTNALQHTLTVIDLILSAAGVTFAALAAVYCVATPQRSLLHGAPARPNDLREDAVALAVAVYLLSAAVFAGTIQLITDQTTSVTSTIVVSNGAHLAGIAVCLYIAAGRFHGGIRRFWFAADALPCYSWVILSVCLAIAAIGLCPVARDATVQVIQYVMPGHEFDPHPTILALHDQEQPIGVIIALWTGAVVVAPIAEEFFFRGLLQTALSRIVHNRWLSIVLASLAFGAIHFQQPHAIAALFVLALCLGYAYERTGSLVPPILIHAAFNLKTLVWDAFGGLPS